MLLLLPLYAIPPSPSPLPSPHPLLLSIHRMEGVEGDGPMWLENVQCPDLAIGCTNAKYYEQCNAIYAEYGERHLLRCSYNIGEEARRQQSYRDNDNQQDEPEEDEPCDRDDQVFIRCDSKWMLVLAD